MASVLVFWSIVGVPIVGKFTKFCISSCSFSLVLSLSSSNLTLSIIMICGGAPWSCVVEIDVSIYLVFSCVGSFPYILCVLCSIIKTWTMESTLVDVSTTIYSIGCLVVAVGMWEGGSCGFILSLVMLATNFCNSSTFTKIGFVHNWACSVVWWRMFFRSSTISGFMF